MKSTEPTKEFFNALLDNTNLKIVKCYRLLFSLNNYINNLGFLIYGIAFVILFIFMLYFFIDFDKLLHSELYQNVKSSPSFSILIKEKPFLESARILNLSDLSSKYSEKALLSKHSDLQEEEIDLNQSPFTYAIRKEHRTIPQIFKDYFILKLDFINILFFPNKYLQIPSSTILLIVKKQTKNPPQFCSHNAPKPRCPLLKGCSCMSCGLSRSLWVDRVGQIWCRSQVFQRFLLI